MAQHEILDEFYRNIDGDFDDEFIDSLKELISNDKFSKENFINLIEGDSDGKE